MFREYVRILALVILHENRISSVLSCVVVPYFPHYLIKCTNFGKLIEHEMCVLIFSTLSKIFPF